MADRTDIDALLIGALYGELAPADEARLTAHLESHPADRTALDDLTRTRAAVRDSRFLAFQLEPSHAISALLLQEASRRAPRLQGGAAAGWFHRLVRSFAAHPAMAAAAMVVLVLGVAGTFYLRGADQFTASPPVSLEPSRGPGAVPSPAASAPSTSSDTMDPEASTEQAEAPHAARAAGSALTSATAGSAGYRVDLDEGGAAKAAPARPAVAGRGDDLSGAATDRSRVSGGFQVGGKDLDDGSKGAGVAKSKAGAPAKKYAGIELRKAEPTPKELGDREDDQPALAKRERAINQLGDQRRAAVAAPPAASPPASPERDQRGAGAVASAGPGGAPPPPPAATSAPAPNAPGAPPPAPEPALAAKPSKAPATGNDRNADKAAANGAKPADKTLDWARKQHDRVIALVAADNCVAAADAALEIYNRAPDYFSASVVTDRSIKHCLAYVNQQRERADRSRNAAKNTNAADPPAQAAPSRK